MGRWKQLPIDGNGKTLKRLLTKLWSKNFEEWKQYHEIRDYLKNLPELKNVSERTIMRYLKSLVEEGFLEKKVEETHRTWYKPKNKAEIYRQSLLELIGQIDDEEFLALLYHFQLTAQSELANGKPLPKAFKVAEEKTLQLWQAAKQLREALNRISPNLNRGNKP